MVDVPEMQTEVTAAELEKYRAMTLPQLRLKLKLANFYVRTVRQTNAPAERKAPAIRKYTNHARVINQVIREKKQVSDSDKPNAVRVQGKPAKMAAKRF